MLDKVEPPSIPEGYAMSVAFSALLDLVRGITTMIERELASEEEAAAEFREAHPDKEWQPIPGLEMRYIKLKRKKSKPPLSHSLCASLTEAHVVWEEMVNACWCGLLAALSLLLDAR